MPAAEASLKMKDVMRFNRIEFDKKIQALDSINFWWSTCHFFLSIFFFLIDFSQDLHEHYADKMIRVEQKVDKLRKAALGQW